MKGWNLKARGAAPRAPCGAAQQREPERWAMGGGLEGPQSHHPAGSPCAAPLPSHLLAWRPLSPAEGGMGLKIIAPRRCCRAPRVSQRAGGACSCSAAEVPRQGERV